MRYRLIVPVLLSAVLAGCGAESTPGGALLELAAASGSIGPNLSTGHDGTTILSWMEPFEAGHRLQYARLDDSGWSAPRTVSQGDNWFVNWADFPSVVALPGGVWAAHWLASQPEGGYAYDVNIAFSTDQGDSWSDPFLPHFDGTPTEHGFVTLYPDGRGVGVVWLDGRKMVNEYDENDVRASGMTLRAGTFGPDQTPVRTSLVDDLTCDCCQTDVALTDDGPIVVYRDRSTDEIRDIYVSRREYGEWQEGVPVSRDHWEIPACPVNGPIVRANGNEVVVAWFTAANDDPQVKAAWSDDGGRSFSAPVVVAEDAPLGHVGGVLLENRDLVVSYHESAGAGAAELYLRRVSPGGKVSAPYLVPAANDVFAFSVPQLALRDDDLIVVWTNEKDGEYSIQSAFVPVTALPTD